MNAEDIQPGAKRFKGTVMNILHQKEKEADVEVVFTPSARFYKLPKSNKNFASILNKLQVSLKNNEEITILVSKDFGDVIEEVTVVESKKKRKGS